MEIHPPWMGPESMEPVAQLGHEMPSGTDEGSCPHGQGASVGDHQCRCIEGQQRSGRKSQQQDQDDQGEEPGLPEQEAVHYRHLLPFGRSGLISRGSNQVNHPPFWTKSQKFNQPLGGNEMARFSGIASFMRLPVSQDLTNVDACFVGIPMDIGASNRAGTRHGPRQIRTESCLIRPYNMGTGAAPFESFQVVDYGDIPINTFNLANTCNIITKEISKIVETDSIPLVLGGDHTLTYPVLRSIAKKHGPVALIHVDAHADTSDSMFNETIAHGTPFRRAYDEKLIDPNKTFQIGLRGSGYSPNDYNWGRSKGFKVFTAEMCWHKSLVPIMDEIRKEIGSSKVYLSFDIDSLDPAFCPGTGTVEMGGLTTIQALEIVRGCIGLNVIGADLVEVSPPYDTTGNTALIASQLLFEMLCVLPGVKFNR